MRFSTDNDTVKYLKQGFTDFTEIKSTGFQMHNAKYGSINSRFFVTVDILRC